MNGTAKTWSFPCLRANTGARPKPTMTWSSYRLAKLLADRASACVGLVEGRWFRAAAQALEYVDTDAPFDARQSRRTDRGSVLRICAARGLCRAELCSHP